MNFEKGDIVVRFNESFISNTFHYDKYMDVGTVTDANDKYFVTNGRPITTFEYTNISECCQESGANRHGPFMYDKWYNYTKNKEEVENVINMHLSNMMDKFRKDNEEEIEKDKKKIEILNKRINDLSTMKYASIGYMDLNISQHVDKLKEVNEKKLKQYISKFNK